MKQEAKDKRKTLKSLPKKSQGEKEVQGRYPVEKEEKESAGEKEEREDGKKKEGRKNVLCVERLVSECYNGLKLGSQ